MIHILRLQTTRGGEVVFRESDIDVIGFINTDRYGRPGAEGSTPSAIIHLRSGLEYCFKGPDLEKIKALVAKWDGEPSAEAIFESGKLTATEIGSSCDA